MEETTDSGDGTEQGEAAGDKNRGSVLMSSTVRHKAVGSA